MADLARLRALLDAPDASWIVERLRTRIARGAGLAGTIALQNPTEAQRATIARMFGRPTPRGRTLSIDLGDLDTLLRRGEICDGVAHAVELLVGHVTDERAVREAVERRWEKVFDDAGSHRADVEGWLADLRATGLLRRVANGDAERARGLLDSAIALADRLPARGVSLAELAASVTGDSHALDAGEPLGTIALRLAARVGARRGMEEENDARPRDIWASVGVLCDELSAPVLVLNLVAATTTATGRALAIHAEAGEPCRLSVRQLLRDPPQFRRLGRAAIHVCENPSVVSSAADRLGAASAPLVCVEGQPRTAARLLLTQLANSGARLVYHGDFDWGGLRIGNVVIGRCDAEPWRFSTADYVATTGGRPLEGRPVDATWDAGLADVMRAAARAVHEEQVMNDLLSDLCPI